MTHEDELRSLESTLAAYKETIKEVNRLGGDGMASVRTEWLLRITELENFANDFLRLALRQGKS